MLYLNLTKGTLISILLDLTYFFCFGFYIMEALDIIDHFLSLKHYHPLASMKQHSPFFLALFLVTTYVLYVGLSSWNYLADPLTAGSQTSRNIYFVCLYVFGLETQLQSRLILNGFSILIAHLC